LQAMPAVTKWPLTTSQTPNNSAFSEKHSSIQHKYQFASCFICTISLETLKS